MTKSDETRLQNLILRSKKETLNSTNRNWLEKLKAKKQAEDNNIAAGKTAVAKQSPVRA
jgi:hypothetical protein